MYKCMYLCMCIVGHEYMYVHLYVCAYVCSRGCVFKMMGHFISILPINCKKKVPRKLFLSLFAPE